MLYLHTLYYIAMHVLPLLLHSFTQYYFLVQSKLINLLMVGIGPSSQQSHSTQHTYTSHSLLHSSLTTCSVIVSVALPPQIRVGSSHLIISVHIILDGPAGNSYIQVAVPHLHSLTTTFYPRTKYVATFSVYPHLSPTPGPSSNTLHIRTSLSSSHTAPPPPNRMCSYAPEEDPGLKVEL